MKRVIFGIFAHPDDEAFGPSGTLLMEAETGTEVHLISLTRGEAGANPDNYTDLGAERFKEWQAAGKLIGAASLHELGYPDGRLSNTDMIEIAAKVEALVGELCQDPEAEIEFMSIDLNGITGHIDHIVAGRASCLAFYRLKQTDPRLTRIRLACIPKSWLPTANTEWLYMESGRDESEITEIIDARRYHDQIVEIMRCHRSQRGDCETHIAQRGESLGLNHFIVLT